MLATGVDQTKRTRDARLTACVAYRLASLVPPPQGRDGSAAILAGNHHSRRLVAKLQGRNVDRVRGILWRGLTRTGRGALTLNHVKLGALGHAVVVGRAAVAAFGSAGAVTTPSAGTGADGHLVGRHVRRVGGVGQDRHGEGRSRGADARGHDGRRALERGRTRSVPRLLV